MDEPNEPIRLRCDTLGEGRPVVVVPWGPGGYGSLYRWALQPLTEHAQLHFWDYRGCGQSSPGPTYSVDDDASDLASLIESLGLDKPVLLGHSYGGMVALRLATEQPALVGGLVLVNTMADAAELRPARERRRQHMTVRRFVQWEQLGMRCIAGEASDQDKLAFLEAEARVMLHGEAHVPDVMRHLRVQFEVLARAQDSLQGFDVTPKLKDLRVPVLVTAGSHDRVAADAPRRLHMALPGSHFVRFTESGHVPFLEEPRKFRDTVVHWLREQGLA